MGSNKLVCKEFLMHGSPNAGRRGVIKVTYENDKKFFLRLGFDLQEYKNTVPNVPNMFDAKGFYRFILSFFYKINITNFDSDIESTLRFDNDYYEDLVRKFNNNDNNNENIFYLPLSIDYTLEDEEIDVTIYFSPQLPCSINKCSILSE